MPRQGSVRAGKKRSVSSKDDTEHLDLDQLYSEADSTGQSICLTKP